MRERGGTKEQDASKMMGKMDSFFFVFVVVAFSSSRISQREEGRISQREEGMISQREEGFFVQPVYFHAYLSGGECAAPLVDTSYDKAAGVRFNRQAMTHCTAAMGMSWHCCNP